MFTSKVSTSLCTIECHLKDHPMKPSNLQPFKIIKKISIRNGQASDM